MSLFGALMADVEDDPFFGSQVRQMNNMMNSMMGSMFSDPFGMFGDSRLAIGGPRVGGAMMPFMPQMPSLNRLFSPDMGGNMAAGSSFSSRTVVMSSGPNGKPQVYSASSSTKIGPGGVKETRKSEQDSRTGLKKMSIGHHIGERAHVVEREQNVYSGDQEERQEFINLDEEEAEDFDREFQTKVGGYNSSGQRGRAQLCLPPAPAAAVRHSPLALPAPPAPHSHPHPHHNASVREVYSGSHPQRQRHRSHKPSHHRAGDN